MQNDIKKKFRKERKSEKVENHEESILEGQRRKRLRKILLTICMVILIDFPGTRTQPRKAPPRLTTLSMAHLYLCKLIVETKN